MTVLVIYQHVKAQGQGNELYEDNEGRDYTNGSAPHSWSGGVFHGKYLFVRS